LFINQAKENEVNKFALFGGDNAYAAGGWQDFLGSFDSIEKAKIRAADVDEHIGIDWWHVVDLETGRYVAAHGFAYGAEEIEIKAND
jgi:hypothetical protein